MPPDVGDAVWDAAWAAAGQPAAPVGDAQKKARAPRGKAATSHAKAQDSQALADSLVDFADFVVVGNVGPEAGINPVERGLVVKSLGEILRTTDAFAKAAKVANPVALALGLGMWGIRVGSVWRAKHPPREGAPTLSQQVGRVFGGVSGRAVPGGARRSTSNPPNPSSGTPVPPATSPDTHPHSHADVYGTPNGVAPASVDTLTSIMSIESDTHSGEH